jgi:hypothetical protein
MPGGRPTLFKPEYIATAKVLCELGATDEDLARAFKVRVRTVAYWKVSHPEFLHALKVGKDTADDQVERALFNRAVGYTYEAVKPMTRSLGGGEGSVIEMVPIKEHVPPDTTAQIFWLKNRRKDQWRDKQDHGFTDKDGNDVALPVTDLGSQAAFLLRKAMEQKG